MAILKFNAKQTFIIVRDLIIQYKIYKINVNI